MFAAGGAAATTAVAMINGRLGCFSSPSLH
jgi:hypothetical protein